MGKAKLPWFDSGSDGTAPPRRLVVGLMSGTSLDGVDVSVVEIKGSGTALSMQARAFSFEPYPSELKDRILRNSIPETSSVSEICALNVELAHVYASAVRKTCSRSAISLEDIDLVGCHGQTIYHDPAPARLPSSTLQIGDPATVSHLLGIPVVGDFRMGDMALGGQGAPLVPYVDWALFSSPEENRVLLNLGGIANVTALVAGCGREEVVAFDTGPANMLVDGLMKRLTGQSYDKDGEMASRGAANHAVIDEWMRLPYFDQSPPKSTGRELFNAAFVDRMMADGARAGLSNEDLIASATMFTVRSVVDSLNRFVEFALDRVIVSGGGQRNTTLMRILSEALPQAHVDSIEQHGVDPDAKEAICFAVLAHEAMNGVTTGMPSVTGATGRAFSGKICFPGK